MTHAKKPAKKPAGKQAAKKAKDAARKVFEQLRKSLENKAGQVLIVVDGAKIVCNQTAPPKTMNILKVPDPRPKAEGKHIAKILDTERTKNIDPWKCKCKALDMKPCDYQPAGTWVPGVQTENCSQKAAKFPNSDQALQAMQQMLQDGDSLTSAAAQMGNILQESDFFQADTEYGGGPGRGWIQWSYSRRGEFEAWSAQQGLNPSHFQTNYDYLKAEMAGQGFGNKNHWTGGRNLDGFKSQQDLDKATEYFEKGFERASKPHMDRRIDRAHKAKDAWKQLKDLAVPELAVLRCNFGGIIEIVDPNQRTKKANIGKCVAHMPTAMK